MDTNISDIYKEVERRMNKSLDFIRKGAMWIGDRKEVSLGKGRGVIREELLNDDSGKTFLRVTVCMNIDVTKAHEKGKKNWDRMMIE